LHLASLSSFFQGQHITPTDHPWHQFPPCAHHATSHLLPHMTIAPHHSHPCPSRCCRQLPRVCCAEYCGPGLPVEGDGGDQAAAGGAHPGATAGAGHLMRASGCLSAMVLGQHGAIGPPGVAPPSRYVHLTPLDEPPLSTCIASSPVCILSLPPPCLLGPAARLFCFALSFSFKGLC